MQDWTQEQQEQVRIDGTIHRYLKGGMTQENAGRELGVSRQAFGRIVQKYAHSSGLDRRRRYDLATSLHEHFGFVLQVSVLQGGDHIQHVPAVSWFNFKPTLNTWPAGHVWLCPPFAAALASVYFNGARVAAAKHGSTVVLAGPAAWQAEPWATEGVDGILTPLGNYHLRRFSDGKKHKLTRFTGDLRVFVFRPGSRMGHYTNTIPEPSRERTTTRIGEQ